MKKVQLNTLKLNKAIIKLNNKINLSSDYSFELLRYTEKRSKIAELYTATRILENNKILSKINLNQLIISKKKALKKGLNELKINNINFYILLVEDIQAYKARIVQKYNIVLS